jgi:tetratricopeptide (TPR) repeat protein
MRYSLSHFCLTVLLLAGVVVPPAMAEVSESDRTLAEQVFQRLLLFAPTPANMPWPPKLEIIDKDEINAFAVMRGPEGSQYPVVVCYNGLLKRVVEGNVDRSAYVLGHEISHHTLGHTRAGTGQTEFLRATFSRDQEVAADRKGMELALQAGYSYLGGLSAIRTMIDLGLNYSSFEGLAADHPSFLDRIALLDKNQAALWRAMSSFDNGVYFLLVQNYLLAERAFRQVTKDFPSSDEAWANLGYALLMQYADSLDTDDLRHFDVGQVVAGGFYRRPKSLEVKVRGINEELWWDAVGALRESTRLKPEFSLPKANLGVAYLFRPAGRDPGKAAQFLEEASQLAGRDPSLDPVSRLAEDINLAVAYAALGDNQKAMTTLGQVETSLRNKQQSSLLGDSSVSNALAYNHAFLLAQSPDGERQRLAISELEAYLRKTDSSLTWWQLAYQRYNVLCKQFGTVPKTENELLSQTTLRFRPVAGLDMTKGQIALGQSLADVKRQLGAEASSTPVVKGTNVVRLDYPAHGLAIIGTDEVLAIVLCSNKASPVSIREMGLGTEPIQLQVGMTSADLDRLLGGSDYDFRQLTDPDLNYRFYSDLGIAALSQEGKIVEFVISQIPKRRVGF